MKNCICEEREGRRTRECGCCSGCTYFNDLSCSFDGADEYVDCGNDASLSFGNGSSDNAFSISAWIKTSDFSSTRIVSKGIYNSNAEYIFSTDGNDLLYLHIMDESVASCFIGRKSASLTAYENQRVHIVGTYNGNGSPSGIKLYLNGSQVDNIDSGSNPESYVAMEQLAHDVWIGRYSTSYLNGKADEVSIWNKELDQYDIDHIYNGGESSCLDKHISSSNLVSWWRMGDEDTWPTILDHKGINDGDMINMDASNFVADVA